MVPTQLLSALVRGALTGKPRKRSKKALRYLTGNRGGLVNAATMMTAAGVAWGLFETWQNNQQQGQMPGGVPSGGDAAASSLNAPLPAMTPTAASPTVPPPLPGTPSASQVSAPAAGVPPGVLRLVRLTVSAARADGVLDADEREAILAQARSVDAELFVLGELDRATPLNEIVAGVTDTREKEALYALAFSIVQADESVTGAERVYLAQLAALLGLDTASTLRLEQEMAGRIDAQDHSD